MPNAEWLVEAMREEAEAMLKDIAKLSNKQWEVDALTAGSIVLNRLANRIENKP